MRSDLIKALPVVLRENAADFGGKIAFEDDRRAVTYRDLEARTRRLAGHLAGLGLRRGDGVMICLRNCVAVVESYLAIVRAGGIGVPVNPASTPAELDYLLADSGAAVVITDPVHTQDFLRCPSLPSGSVLLVTGGPQAPGAFAHSYDRLAETEPAQDAQDDLGLDDVAWMFYTSGTTGKPKGVLSTQRNCLYSVAASYVPIPGLSADDRVLWPLPLFHSLSHIACVLSVTVVGATARIMDATSADDVLTALRKQRSTFLAGVPTTYHYLVQAMRQQPFSVPDLRIGLVGGAVASPELCRAFRESFDVPLVDAYGSTETCGAITMNPPGGIRADGSCGLPVPGVKVRLVDAGTGLDVPAGAEGEVWVSGPNVMAGYHNKPEATAAALRDGWYRTGDLAKRDEAGYFTVCGRITDLIIRGGENVHPEEIEAVIRGTAGVADAGVAGRPHEVLGEVPVAYVVPDFPRLDAQALIGHCRERLSAFKVPEEVYEVTGIPRTSSGKIKRRLLADQPARLLYAASGLSHSGGPPGDPPAQSRPDEAVTASLRDELSGLDERARLSLLQRLVRSEAAGVLRWPGPQAVPLDRAFRDLGYTSVAVVELRNRLTARTGLRLPATISFDHPTPRELAAFLHSELAGGPQPQTWAGAAASLDEPVAIIGMSCRLPGGIAGPDDLWRLVSEGREALSPFPADRGWDLAGLFDSDPDHARTSYVDRGGFLDGAAEFDADFFGISPREALAMDPQQRLLLETSWEALEQAGIDASALKGTDVGVFTGVMDQGYGTAGNVPAELEAFVITGAAASVASGRVSYVFGFCGPAVTVDTACSSSLVALHLAAQALRNGECSMTLAGGATVMATPRTFVEFSRQRTLAADGRCKPYSSAADGTGWAEGAGVLVLERLRDARRHGHQVLAVLRGSAVNQDGASNGLTAPSGLAQQRVIRRALAVAGLGPADVDAVEGHGTGTVLGDPIEAQALLATYGQGRDRQRPLWLGSLKSNIGHAQAAAGVASVIKMVQALRHGFLPATLHAAEPTPKADWSSGAVSLLTDGRPWPDHGRPRRAGVSGFGLSGTNAHVILEEAPREPPGTRGAAPARPPAVVPFVVSARSQEALKGQARRLASFLAAAEERSWADVAGALLSCRAVMTERAVVLAGSRDEALAGLTALADDEASPIVVRGTVTDQDAPRRVALVFPGQGSQWAGMGADLLDASPVFAERVAECARLLGQWADWSLLDVLRGQAEPELLHRADVIQPASFAVMVGLAAVWASAGVTPDAVVGHSQGEIAAACVAGALSLADAIRVVTLRSQVIAASLSGLGGMASVALGAEAAADLVRLWAGRVEVAAVNGPSSVVLSGDAEAMDEVIDALARDGIQARRIAVDYASHSRVVDGVRDALAEVLAGVKAHAPAVPFHSTVTGGIVEDAGFLAGGYWYRNLREQVRFGPAIAALLSQGLDVFVEASAHPVLVQPIAEIISEQRPSAVVAGSLRRDDGGLRRLATSMAELFVQGVAVDWTGILPAGGGERVDLPTYAFEHRHYWLRSRPAADAAALGLAGAGHPLLGAVVRLPGSGGLVATARWSPGTFPWLATEPSGGAITVPEAALVEVAVRLGDKAGTQVVSVLTVDRPVVLPGQGGLAIRIVVGEADAGGRRPIDIYSRADDQAAGQEWTRHAHGALAPSAAPPDRRDPGTATEVALGAADLGEAHDYGMHPALLDAAVHTAIPGSLRPWRWTGVQLLAAGASAILARSAAGEDSAADEDKDPRSFRLELTDPAGVPVMTVDKVDAKPSEPGRAGSPGSGSLAGLFRVAWVRCQAHQAAAAASPAVEHVATAEDVAAATADLLIHEADTSAGDPSAAVCAILGLLQAFVTRPGRHAARLAVVTRDSTGLAAAAVRGLVRSAQSEHPGRFVLVDAGDAPRPAVAAAVTALGGEPQIRLRDVRVEAPRLARAVLPAEPAGDPAFMLDPAGTVLVTGGTGTLAAVTARHLVAEHGVRHLILVSRRGAAADGAAELRDSLAALGADVLIAAVDAADRDQLAALLDTVPAEHPLTAVVHAAGVLDDGVLTALDAERVDTVFRPKLDAALHLHELTRGLDLAAFVLFSSAAGVLGNPGQGNYAAANAALDALAGERRRLGLPAVSLAWGYWDQESGLTRHLSEADLRRHRGAGMAGLAAADAMALFDAAIRAGAGSDPMLVAARFDLAALGAAGTTIPPLLRGLAPARRPRSRPAAGPPPSSLATRISALPSHGQQVELLVDLVRQHAAAVLGHPGIDAVHPDRTFKETGFDSLTALELRNRLAAATGLQLSPAMIFDYPRPAALAGHLRAGLLGEAARQPVTAAAAALVGEPIAIVSMACRFPAGVRSPEDLWQVVITETDAVTEFPLDRGWDTDLMFHPDPDHPGTSYVRHGAFLDDAAGFDAAFFGISPNEALAMDPQQRLLMEISWEAFERAGIDPTCLAGQNIAVFAGVNSHDWTVRTHYASDVEGYRLTGGSGSVVSGRIAYYLGLEGPAITVDTACSSSLVALHLAVQALRNGECSMALAGGAMVMGTVQTFVEFSRQRGLAPDGRCKAFANAADGTGWSEGAGLLLVEPLSQARLRGHQVLAVIRGTAVNQDGASNGLTAPNGLAQQQVIRKALAAAGLRPDDVDAVEGHGTGTTLGDPIEANALLETYGRDRPPGRPLWLGSVKSNIGHSQAAAGVAGVIKMVLAMRHGILPKTLHVDHPTAHVDWSAGTVRLLTSARDWPGNGRPRRAGVSSFGIGGTNAHLILEQAPACLGQDPARPAGPSSHVVPVPLSARSRAGLSDQAGRLADFLEARPEVSITDAALALATARAHLDRRAVLVACDRERLIGDLRALQGGSPPAIDGSPVTGKLAFLFTGQGGQWAGMGRALAAAFPAFAEAFAGACHAMQPHLAGYTARPLADVVFADPGSQTGQLLDQTMYTQAGLFAVETALFRLFASWGVRPGFVAGHSVGEITAAHVSGTLGLGEAAELVAVRGRLMQALPRGGAMAAVQATEAEVAPLLAAERGVVVVAAVNSADSLVLSGDEAAVLAVARELAGRGRKTRRLPVSHAFHSPLMEPMLAEFGAVAGRLEYRPGDLPVVSTLTGQPAADGQLATPRYWVEQVTGTVRFADAVAALRDQGVTTFLELGPGGGLTAMALETLGAAGGCCCYATLHQDSPEVAGVTAALGELHARGVAIDWPDVLGRQADAAAALAAELPTYAFQHQRYWIDEIGAADGGGQPAAGQARQQAPDPAGGLAGEPAAERERVLLGLIRDSAAAVLGYRDADHGVFGDDQPFSSLGFDSLSAVRLRHRLYDLTGVDLPATSVFDYPTPKALAAFLSGELSGERADLPGPVVAALAEPDEPIAIVGMAVRLPGADSPDELWRLVTERRDAISGFPIDRGWDLDRLYHADPGHPGTSYTRSGGFLHDAAQFDAGLFGISPREALAMDPQQRLLLEASWEALERAGIDPLSVRGQDVGVFTGIVHHDYVTRLHQVPEEAQGYIMTGTSPSVASGRVAYVFGFEGPAMTVDTACSSSLVAIHLAAQALRRGECSMALAGGATVMASPSAFIEFSRQRGLSADGRCKSFSSTADGTGWSEGVGVVVLTRLSVARERGHQVLAVVRGSAVNQDGASNGLTAPNGPSQRRVIWRALASAGLGPADVDAVEAHGTGTVLGDPIEAQALLATYGQGRDRERPLWLGSLKSNIGHTQAAAGVAGVIKMVQALRHGVLPPTLHVDEPTPQVDWSPGTVRLLTRAQEWPRAERPRRAGVSAFGASGTNAHLILEEAPAWQVTAVGEAGDEPPQAGAWPAVVPLVLSAKSPRSLTAQAARLAAFAGDDGQPGDPAVTPLPAMASALVTTRAALPERAVVVAGSHADALAGLGALARGESAPNLVTGSAARSGALGKVVLVFPGQGSQWAGMGRELLDTSAVFRERIAECASALEPWVDWPLASVLRGEAGKEVLERVDVVQPASFAMMVGLAAVWASMGVTPDAVLGHSQGEIAAACVAGALSLADAARVVAVRSQAVAATLSGQGGMASVMLSPGEVSERLAAWQGRLEVAAVNGPSAVVIAGDTQALSEAVEALARQGARVRQLPVDYASHTRHVQDLEDALSQALAGIGAQPPKVPFYSTVTGGWLADGENLDGRYWYRNLRQPVGFGPAVADLLAGGYGVFVEVSAHPVLVQPITDVAGDAQPADTAAPAVISGTLRRNDGGASCLLASAARLFAAGAPVDWTAALPAGTGTVPGLPTYAFEHQHYWLAEAREVQDTAAAARGADSGFWTAVDEADTAVLTEMLGLSAGQSDALSTVLPALADWRKGCEDTSAAEKLRYTVTWKPLEREAVGIPGGRWLAVVPADEGSDWVVRSLLEAMTGQGLDLVRLAAAEGGQDRSALAGRLAGRLAAVLAGHDVSGVLSLLAIGELTGAGPQDPAAIAASSIALIQALTAVGVTAPLWCLTRGAVNIGIRDVVRAPAQAALWGLGRVAALERPDRWGGLIDLPADLDAKTVQRLLGVLRGAFGEDQLAIRRSGVYVRRLGRKPVLVPAADRRWQPRDTILVTGGAEGLGRHASLWLARAGAGRLVVTTSARTPEGSVDALRSQLAELSAGTTVESCDDLDRDAITRLAGSVHGQPLTAVVHAADITQASLVDDTNDEDIAEVFGAKVATAVWLSQAFADLPLDAFVLFSSIAGVWGGGGQGSAGAANAFLDALADWLRSRGLPAMSIAWGALNEAGVGMDEAALAQLRRRGVLQMTPSAALAALAQAVRADEKFLAVADMDWASFIPPFTSVRPSQLFADLPEAQTALKAAQPDGDTRDTTASLVGSLRAVAAAEQNRILLRLVRSHAAIVLGHSGADGIGQAQAFQEAGFDSLAAVNFRNSLTAATGLRLPATLIFDFPTPEALVGYLRTELLREDELDGRENDLRRVLATVPFARFREAGVLQALLDLSGPAQPDSPAQPDGPAQPDAPASGQAPPDDDEEELIDALDIGSLVRRALGNVSA